MIKTKEDLIEYLNKDMKRYGNTKRKLKDRLLRNDWWYFYHYLYNLRKLEYHINNNHKIKAFIRLFIHKRYCNKLRIYTYPNTLGAGIRFYHIGNFTEIKRSTHIGDNCTILSGVVIGNKGKEMDNHHVSIGNNCYIGLNVGIFGSIKIGNNVIIGANSIVTKDIPDNCIAAGVPAKIIKRC